MIMQKQMFEIKQVVLILILLLLLFSIVKFCEKKIFKKAINYKPIKKDHSDFVSVMNDRENKWK